MRSSELLTTAYMLHWPFGAVVIIVIIFINLETIVLHIIVSMNIVTMIEVIILKQLFYKGLFSIITNLQTLVMATIMVNVVSINCQPLLSPFSPMIKCSYYAILTSVVNHLLPSPTITGVLLWSSLISNRSWPLLTTINIKKYDPSSTKKFLLSIH